MQNLLVIGFSLLCLVSAYQDPKIDHREVRCLVCKAVVDEMDKAVEKVDPKRKVDIGGYRLDSYGNKEQKQVQYARSELHLTEVMEEVCNKMDDYVRGRFKSNNVLTLLKLIDDSGSMNPLMSEVDLIQDSDLNKSLKFYCEGIVEEFEEPILKLYADHAENMKTRLCVDSTNLCPSSTDEDNDTESDYFSEERDEL
ncbi:hypothetical protein R5R35_003771 [Gryllus longicercus]|uniref:DUF3456 domain-containing protein n=1 Tax=Gryllus longicercus TaxID=2509291 RepID=A0AAN9V5Y4_9ORTH